MRKGFPAVLAAMAVSAAIPFQALAMPAYVFRDVGPDGSAHASAANDRWALKLRTLARSQANASPKGMVFETVFAPKGGWGKDSRKASYSKGASDKITVRKWVSSEEETLMAVVHEFGHAVAFRIPSKDVDAFNAVSWSDGKRKTGATLRDFVSGYAMSSRHEDFAESYLAYVMRNEWFRKKASSNPALKAKYDFFRNEVFPEGTFVGTDFTVGKLESAYDMAAVKSDMDAFFAHVRKVPKK